MVNDAGDKNGVKTRLKIRAYIFNANFVSKSFQILEKNKTKQENFEFSVFIASNVPFYSIAIILFCWRINVRSKLYT